MTNVSIVIVFRQLGCRKALLDVCELPFALTLALSMVESSVEALLSPPFLQSTLEPRAAVHQRSLVHNRTDPLNGLRDQVNLQSSTAVLLYPSTQLAGALQKVCQSALLAIVQRPRTETHDTKMV
jgi:hypothetical protein